MCVYENTCPMCNEPEAVGGGVSIAKTLLLPVSIARARSNEYVPSASHTSPQVASSPSRAGLSGISRVMTNSFTIGGSGYGCLTLVFIIYQPRSFR
ncbi:unannotated protein [freshwater metagenome]|uniref:Unannotated protein n=1 Tax=freshwater metagenome TaxID=449393 RepID=A0A6J6GH05_9ZZZZ